MSAPAVPEEVATPALVVDADVVERSVARMQATADAAGVRLRPHAKTHKSVQVARLQLAAGAPGLTVATLGEAEVFAAAGVGDLFVAYPVLPVGAGARRLAALRERAALAVGIDSPEGAAAVAAAAPGLTVLVEVDPGNARTGVDADLAGALAAQAARLGLDVAGVFSHGGHGYTPGARGAAAADEVRALTVAAASLRAHGVEPRVLSAGSTPTASGAATAPVTEIRPGTYVYGDRQQVLLGAVAPGEVALVVVATVVSRSVRRGEFVVDAAAKILSKDRAPWLEGYGHVVEHPDAVLHRVDDHHGVARVDGGPLPAVGDRVRIVPNHVCPVVNLVDEVVVVRAGQVAGRWRVDARGAV